MGKWTAYICIPRRANVLSAISRFGAASSTCCETIVALSFVAGGMSDSLHLFAPAEESEKAVEACCNHKSK